MRELEFLPEWYPRWLVRRRALRLQISVLLMLVAGGAGWTAIAQRNLTLAQEALGTVSRQVAQRDIELGEMRRLEALGKIINEQEQVQARLGVQVESVRLISMLASLMPANLSLLSLELESEEAAAAPMTALARAVAPVAAAPDRRLKVKLTGVAPTDVDLANFVTELNKVAFFERVSPTYFRERRKDGHVMREFELTFVMNLNTSTGT